MADFFYISQNKTKCVQKLNDFNFLISKCSSYLHVEKMRNLRYVNNTFYQDFLARIIRIALILLHFIIFNRYICLRYFLRASREKPCLT